MKLQGWEKEKLVGFVKFHLFLFHSILSHQIPVGDDAKVFMQWWHQHFNFSFITFYISDSFSRIFLLTLKKKVENEFPFSLGVFFFLMMNYSWNCNVGNLCQFICRKCMRFSFQQKREMDIWDEPNEKGNDIIYKEEGWKYEMSINYISS